MPHATATVNGVVVAETDTYEVVDGNIYVCFPPSILLTPSHYIEPTPFFIRFFFFSA